MSKIKAEYGTRKALAISVGALTEIGLREENQDNMTGFASPIGTVYLVADGMGGYRGGAEASRLVTDGFRRYVSAAPNTPNYWETLSYAAQQTNRDLMQISASGDPQNSGMGSTVVIAVIREGDSGPELITAHVGDSRVYIHRGGVLTLLTKDHTRVQWLIDSHGLDETSARLHPDASVLTRAFGHTPDMTIDVSKPIPLVDGDGILLCSDGLSGFAGTEDINQVIKQHPDPSECARELIQLALNRGSNDNITVQFIRIGRSPRSVFPPLPNKRPTLPEGAAIAAPPQATRRNAPRSQPLRMAFLGLLIGALIGGGGIYAFRDRIFGKKPVPHEQAAPQTAPSPRDTLVNNANGSVKTALALLERVNERAKTIGNRKLKEYQELTDAAKELSGAQTFVQTSIASLNSCADTKQLPHDCQMKQTQLEKGIKALNADVANIEKKYPDLKAKPAGKEPKEVKPTKVTQV